jgi:hypothetical protein
VSKQLAKFRELIIEAAVNHLAVEDFDNLSDVFPTDDNAQALTDFHIERDNSMIEVINYVLSHGSLLRFELLSDQAERMVNSEGGYTNM